MRDIEDAIDIGLDAASGLVYSLIGTAGNVSDVTQAHMLLHHDENAALVDAGYQGVEKRADLGKSVTCHVTTKRSNRNELPGTSWDACAKNWSISRRARGQKWIIRSIS